MPQNGCNKHAAQKPEPSHEWQSENGSAKAEAKCAEISKTENEKIPAHRFFTERKRFFSSGGKILIKPKKNVSTRYTECVSVSAHN